MNKKETMQSNYQKNIKLFPENMEQCQASKSETVIVAEVDLVVNFSERVSWDYSGH